MGRLGKYPRYMGGRRKRRSSYIVRRVLPALIVVAGFAGIHVVEEGKAFVGRHFNNVAAVPPPLAQTSLQGRASVVDGDTIEIGGQRIRFNGIDAPEGTQSCKDDKGRAYPCGRQAAAALDGFLAASQPTRCELVEWDQYGRFVGNCFRADGRSVAEWLVGSGHALDWPRHSAGAYATWQAQAKRAKTGIWRGEFQVPWEWRAEHRTEQSGLSNGAAVSAPSSPSFTFVGSTGCNIKGNISDKGERIYHVPGQKFYTRTRIAAGKGERWFCSEAEAQKAGWRKAKR